MRVLGIRGSPRNGNTQWMLAAALGPAVGAPVAPAVAFEVSAELTGSAGSIATRHVAARLGESDLGEASRSVSTAGPLHARLHELGRLERTRADCRGEAPPPKSLWLKADVTIRVSRRHVSRSPSGDFDSGRLHAT